MARRLLILGLLTASLCIPRAAAAHDMCFADKSPYCFPEPFSDYWEANGGLPVFGYPITAAADETNADTGQAYLTQWAERNRFEVHPENAGTPYAMLLGLLGKDRLRQLGRDPAQEPRAAGPADGCLWFDQTGHAVCNQSGNLGFRTYWESHGLAIPGLDRYSRSLQLFGLPLTEPRMETNGSGDTVLTQWFERARFEWHPNEPDQFKVLLGLLGSEIKAGTLSPLPPAAGLARYVAPAGSDSNDGSAATPWRTIQKAADTATPGTTVFIRGGVYPERVTINVSGSAAAGPITFQSYPGEQAVIDGANLPADSAALVALQDRSYIVLKNLEIRNLRPGSAGIVPIGIALFGANSDIELRNNVIHHIEANYAGHDGANGHGIAVYGDRAEATRRLVIDGNELADLKLGSSEALVVNGNVDGFVISNNLVHDVDNIAIDAVGYEGVAPTEDRDRARNGLIADNRVWNVDSATNPAYGATCDAGNPQAGACAGGSQGADGIYVDGGAQITIERNLVLDCNIGIEVASEHAGKSAEYVTVRSNIIGNVDFAGISLGGYGADPTQAGGGSARFNAVVNNTIYTPAQGWALVASYRVSDSTIANNLVVAASDAQRMLIDPASYLRNTETGNLLRTATTASPNPANLFVSATRPTNADLRMNAGSVGRFLHITPGSEAHNQGSPIAAGDQDIDHQARVAQGAIDIGADELP